MVHRVTTSDNEWYNEWQRMTTSGTTSDNEWQRVTTSDKEWQRVVQRMTTNVNEWPFQLIFLFFLNKRGAYHQVPKGELFKPWRRPIELRAETSTQKKKINSKKQELKKQLFAYFHQNSVLKNLAIFSF